MTAVATIVGASARRSMMQRATALEDPYADEDFDTLDRDRGYMVITPDRCRGRSAKPARWMRR